MPFSLSPRPFKFLPSSEMAGSLPVVTPFLASSLSPNTRFPPSADFNSAASARRKTARHTAPLPQSRLIITFGRRGPSSICAVSVEESTATSVRIVSVVGEGSASPIKGTPWEEIMLHTANRLKLVNEGFEMCVYTDKAIQLNGTNLEKLRNELTHSNMLVNVAIKNHDSIAWLQKNSETVPNIICFESSPSLLNKLGGSFVQNKQGNFFHKVADVATRKRQKEYEVVKTVLEAWERHNSDDIRFCLLVIINSYIQPVSVLKNLRAKGLSTLNCMLKNCRSEILNCLFDPNCRKALQCLNACSPTDQVCNYRCIASYESPYLEAFSLCVLQKNNCLQLDAEIPSKPCVAPLSTFNGEELSHEIAEDLFIGWLGDLEWSWRVAAGQNPAYDQFPCQYQLFYRGKAKGSFWYEPVFQVRTIEGELVWRRRKYRVRRGRVPGTFHFSVLDNGLVSNEFWTIVDVSEDLGWGLFHYSGAAKAAGLSYTGAVLVTPDGMYPPEKETRRLVSAMERCSIKDWELYMVDNCSCTGPPLGIPKGSSLHFKLSVRNQISFSG